MFKGFDKIIEERIRTAQRNGKFDNLPGKGKPLKLEDDHRTPEELRMAYKILKNADCLPPEVEVKKEIRQTKELLAGMEEASEKYGLLKKLNFLIMKLNVMRNTSIDLELPQYYTDKLTHRLDSKTKKIPPND